MKKRVLAVCFFMIFCLIFGSCGQKGYSDTLTCTEITSELKEEIFAENGYSDYSSNDIKYMFDDDTLFDSCSVIYSSSSDDVGEIGVLHASDAESADALLETVNGYLKELDEEKRAFLKSYLPNELEKLDNAEAKRFGNYVAFVVLEPTTRDAVFERLEAMLMG